MNFDLRDVSENDFEWLYNLRFRTMLKYVLESGDQFTRETQTRRIKQKYESIKIIRVETQDIGMLKIEQNDEALKIIQIQLLPEYQCLGIGTKLIESLQREASRKDIPIFLSVLKVNPAKHLYKRLGFEIVEEKEKSFTMRYYA